MPQNHVFKICRIVCRVSGVSTLMKSTGSGGMPPQKILKIRFPRLAKIDMKNATKFNQAASIFTQKWSKKRITPQACFTNTSLKNNNFTASCTKIDSISITTKLSITTSRTKYLKFTFSRKKIIPKTHHAKILGGGGGGAIVTVVVNHYAQLG